jgi:3-dehydroquinate synthase
MHRNMERIKVNLEGPRKDAYEILIGKKIINRGAFMARVKDQADRFVIITDSNVNPLYGELLRERAAETGSPVDIVEVPAGEASKSFQTILEVARHLVRLKVSRKSLLIALGGGVVGDLAGFMASIYMRSIPYIQIPTTLLAQVDSSVGGKTGIDLPEGKNLLGTFYQPRAVYIELSFLETLSDRHFGNGLAEIIKYGIIADENLFEFLETEINGIKNRNLALVESLVARSCKIKADVVEMDEKELGLRRVLNFGHTIGHALEAASDYALFHGEAVAIGMVAAAKISEKLNVLNTATCERISDLIEHYGLPTHVPEGIGTDQITAFLGADKKTVGGQVHLVLVKRIGVPFVTADVSLGVIRGVVEELRP